MQEERWSSRPFGNGEPSEVLLKTFDAVLKTSLRKTVGSGPLTEVTDTVKKVVESRQQNVEDALSFYVKGPLVGPNVIVIYYTPGVTYKFPVSVLWKMMN
jgi:hypothetical protein